jgi:Peptidase family S41
MKFFFISVALVLISDVARAQTAPSDTTSLPNLSTRQMYHDYDVLVKALLEISPQYEFRKKITGTDIKVFYRENRKKIESIKSHEAFYRLIRSLISANQDSHTSVLRSDYLSPAIFKQFGVSDSAISNSKGWTYFYNKINSGNRLNFQFRYIDGKYYNVVPFTYHGKYYHSGLEITDCNGLPINQYVNSLYPYLVMKWDFVHHIYFADAFFKSFNLSSTDQLTLNFKGDATPAGFIVGDSVMLANQAVAVAPKVKKFIWFADQKILYIRMPAMEVADTDYYASEILKYRNYKIDKIVIDIRDNGGGSDYVWRRLVSNIITEPIIYNVVTLANHNDRVIKLLKGLFDATTTIKVPFLNDLEFYADNNQLDTIPMSDSSIKFNGKVFILQNKNNYSSAGAFLAIGNRVKNFYTLGEPTGTQLGLGINPLIAELPESGIVYRVEPIVEYTDVKAPEDIFHNKVKIPVILTLQNVQDIIQATDRYSGSFLLNKDPMFRKVLGE